MWIEIVDLLPFLSMISARREIPFPFAGFFTVIPPFRTSVFFQVLPTSYETYTDSDLRFRPLAAPNRTGSRTGGTGLGLTIATGQARLLGARLTFRNHPEGGAETELRLPPD
ncbi:hypothetical protein [Streptomyces sp. MA5143a]|uniref:hypothetical protein n=1 Tax=Streptomyces sp. MA5143a TaxID=2083010 RepID=UPI000D271012|nr:Sensor protein CseC [Streptomyces sp. MA5143a]